MHRFSSQSGDDPSASQYQEGQRWNIQYQHEVLYNYNFFGSPTFNDNHNPSTLPMQQNLSGGSSCQSWSLHTLDVDELVHLGGASGGDIDVGELPGVPPRQRLSPSSCVHGSSLTEEVPVSETGNNEELVHFGTPRVNHTNPEEVKKFKIWLENKYNFQLVHRVEVRAIIETGSANNGIGSWEVYVEHPFGQKYLTRIKRKKTEICLQWIGEWFKRCSLLNMKGFKCWLPQEEPCVYKPFYPEDICAVHYRGSEEDRLEEIQHQLSHKFAPKILKFVVGTDFMAFVTDPEKLGVDDVMGNKFWYVNSQTVQDILANLAHLELGGFFCEER